MTHSLRLFGIAGSLREHAYSRCVLNAVAEMLPAGSQMRFGDIGGQPFYNQDLEQNRLPESVSEMRREVEISDAVIIVSPEYNHGMPGGLKNALDWLSRPAFKSSMVNKPVFFLTLSEGMLGGVRAQLQLRETLAAMLCIMPPLPEIAITNIGTKIEDGKLTDATTLAFIQRVLNNFLSTIVA